MDNRIFLILGIIMVLVLAVLAVFLASSNPDGLESTALVVQGQKTLTGDTPSDAAIREPTGAVFSYNAPMTDYSIPGPFGKTGDALAMVAGVILALLIVFGVAKFLTYTRRNDQ
jgi:cobalt/nickel transport protein